MSYILDALRRADAERDRGAVPGLHTQSTLAGSVGPSADSPAGRPPWLWLGAGALSAVVIGGIAWAWLGTAARHEAPVVTTATPTTSGNVNPPAAMPTRPAAQDPPQPSATVADALPSPPRDIAPSPAPATPTPARNDRPGMTAPARQATASPRTPANPARTAAAAVNHADATPAAATGSDAALPSPSATPVVAERIYTVSELPDDLQRELPKLAVGGSMYSPTPASRLLIVNGQVLHEGDTLPPGLVLRQIRLKSAVFSYRDRRFEIRY